jgi:hypothetical protein
LLVVSTYNYRPQGSSGYISGACGQPGQPTCPNDKQKYIHDFGSILNFIEYAFGTGGQPLHVAGFPPTSGISPSYFYADVFAPDGSVVRGGSCLHPYSLSDFFNFSGGPSLLSPSPNSRDKLQNPVLLDSPDSGLLRPELSRPQILMMTPSTSRIENVCHYGGRRALPPTPAVQQTGSVV